MATHDLQEDWSRREVELIVDDYLSMLAAELAGMPYNKTNHRNALLPKLNGRSKGSVEFKHANISAVLVDMGIQPIRGYKKRSNYQAMLADVVAERVGQNNELHRLALADAEQLVVVPEVEDILSILTTKPEVEQVTPAVKEAPPRHLGINHLEREARNQSLGHAGELFILNYETARLVAAGKEQLASKIEHTSKVKGDYEGYDILSFEESGEERLIEVKTTKYGADTPFFVSRHEVSVSEREAARYQVYRLFDFKKKPSLFLLPGAIPTTCRLTASTFLATVA
jgi:hypothetical protein